MNSSTMRNAAFPITALLVCVVVLGSSFMTATAASAAFDDKPLELGTYPLAGSGFTPAVADSRTWSLDRAVGILNAPEQVREYRIALLVGVLGAFTTFSTFGWETFALANGGQVWLAVVNIAVTNTVCLVAVWLGYRMGETWFGV